MATYFGGTLALGSTGLALAANFIYFWPATCTLSGNVTDGQVWYQSGGGNIKLAVFADSAGVPGAKLGESGVIALSGSAGVRTTTFGTPFPVVSGTQYWLAWLAGGGGPPTMGASSGGPVSYRFLSATYPTYPSSGSGSSAGSAFDLAIQAGVTAAAAAFVPRIMAVT